MTNNSLDTIDKSRLLKHYGIYQPRVLHPQFDKNVDPTASHWIDQIKLQNGPSEEDGYQERVAVDTQNVTASMVTFASLLHNKQSHTSGLSIDNPALMYGDSDEPSAAWLHLHFPVNFCNIHIASYGILFYPKHPHAMERPCKVVVAPIIDAGSQQWSSAFMEEFENDPAWKEERQKFLNDVYDCQAQVYKLLPDNQTLNEETVHALKHRKKELAPASYFFSTDFQPGGLNKGYAEEEKQADFSYALLEENIDALFSVCADHKNMFEAYKAQYGKKEVLTP